eukprot:12870067-Alexandrium_andersonii.AAC.1
MAAALRKAVHTCACQQPQAAASSRGPAGPWDPPHIPLGASGRCLLVRQRANNECRETRKAAARGSNRDGSKKRSSADSKHTITQASEHARPAKARSHASKPYYSKPTTTNNKHKEPHQASRRRGR